MLPQYIYLNETEFPSLGIWHIVLNDQYKASLITSGFCLTFLKVSQLAWGVHLNVNTV